LDKIVRDQAEGLRRLLARDVSRVVAVVAGAPRAGASSAVVNLAAALAVQGKDVLVLDEQADGLGLSASLGISPGGNLADVMAGRLGLADAVARVGGVAVLPAPRLAGGASHAELTRALNGLADLILVDAGLDADGALSTFAAQAHDVVVTMQVDSQSITGAYACIKRLHYAHAIKQFRILINGAATSADALGVFQNLSTVASRYLAVALVPAGAVSQDARVARAQALHRSVVDAFPAAAASVDFRRVAADLLHWPWRPVAPVNVSQAAASSARTQPQLQARPDLQLALQPF
jgi:flagellar biosynthesis protein FlhG